MAHFNAEEEKQLLQHSILGNVLTPDDIGNIQSYHSYASVNVQRPNLAHLNGTAAPQQYLKATQKIRSKEYSATPSKTQSYGQTASLSATGTTSISPRTPTSLQSLLNVNYGTFTTKSADRLSMFTKLIVPYYMLTFLVSVFGLILFYLVPYADFHSTIFTVFLASTVLGSVVGMVAEWKWSAISSFRYLLYLKNAEWRQSINELVATKQDLKHKVASIEFSVDKLGRNAAELEQSLRQFDALRSELEKLTSKSQHVVDVLDALLRICEDLRSLIREHAKTELMVAYFDAAIFCKNRHTNSIRLTGNKWKNFRARLDSETRRVFDDKGGFDALDHDRDGKVYISDLANVLSFVIDERGFDEIYDMFG